MYNPQNKRLILRFVGWFFLINSILFWIVGSIYLKKILLSPSLFANFLADYSTFSGKILVVSFALVNYLSYMMVLAFIPAILIWILAYILPAKRFIWFLSVLTATLSLMLLIINNCVFSMFKFHLNMDIFNLFFNGQWHDVFDFSGRELKISISALCLVWVLQVAIAFFVWNKIIVTDKFLIGRTIGLFWLGGFLFSYFTLLQSIDDNNNLFSQQTPNLPFYNQLIVYLIPDKNAEELLDRYGEGHFYQPVFSNDPLNYPLHSLRCSRPENPPNIIWIMVDSLRFDSLQPEYMPNVAAFAERSWQFKKHLSGGNSTQPGLFSLFYSIPSSYWTSVLEQNIPPVFTQLLLKYHYMIRVIWSSEMIIPPFDKTIYGGISNLNLFGASGDDIGNRDRFVTEEAIKFLTEKKLKQPFFLNLFYDAPHGYCRDQSYPAPYQPAIKECSRIAMTNDVDPIPYYNRYLNSVRFIDGELAKILTRIEEQGYLKNSIVLITSDHGQEFNDNNLNYWGHAGNFTAVQVQVPLILYWPGQSPRVIHYETSSYDVVPTLLKRAFDCQNPFVDYSIGQDLLDEKNRLPFVLAGSYSTMALIERDRQTTLRTSGGALITNVRGEPIPDAKPRMPNLKKALELMRLYYSR
ncbi:DUF3413 domain-containing protein [Legionella bononiensis]|uniref:DUF3413 domain-containing protein n=1 Tax=Legionella bononiensis TaxID=2793102 RepID=A0ABS1W9B9_9GAMM|nr:DUF3413 domain-containing protein [Legionella bononiensis]MBL7480869.1 DUF3413 domain-containing protein [Legionella bononiensis]MBL7525949.1 DUF3413 domain-containing protein [Legionella bononiensis]MBL7563984.1 DUF3413 domain-containing protein [Legionella bononiensis]